MRESSGEPSIINICDSDSPERVMIIIIGLVILVAAVVAAWPASFPIAAAARPAISRPPRHPPHNNRRGQAGTTYSRPRRGGPAVRHQSRPSRLVIASASDWAIRLRSD